MFLVGRVRSQTASLFVLRDRLVAAEDAVVDVIIRDFACLNRQMSPDGVVTLLCDEREVSPPQELSGHCDCGPPRVHRRGAERAVRWG
jgi:hypothetical protein